MDDLYKRERKILQIKEKFKSECERCYKVIEKFEHALRLNQYSTGRIEKYWSFLKTLHHHLGVCFEDAKREDIEKLVIKIDTNPEWAEWTKTDMKKILKIFYRWLKFGNLEGDYPDIVKWIKPKMKRNNSKTPDMILTKEEIELMANNTTNPRDRALVLTLYETGARIGEFLGMRIKDIGFDQYGCYVLISGKTGWRRVRIIEYSKDFLAWLDAHPFKNNPESYVWINLENPSSTNRITPANVNNLLKSLASKCNITKRVHNHALRHARATHLAKHLPEQVLKQIFGWTNDSKVVATYTHLSGRDVDEALLRLHGVKFEENKEEKVGVKICPRCGTPNNILAHFCKNCGAPLDLKVMIEVEEEKKKLNEFLRDFLVYYAEKNPSFKKAFIEFVKMRNAFDLFGIDGHESRNTKNN
jgi:integrase/ribosomal protein L40E